MSAIFLSRSNKDNAWAEWTRDRLDHLAGFVFFRLKEVG
jgi:hypothetical protein